MSKNTKNLQNKKEEKKPAAPKAPKAPQGSAAPKHEEKKPEKKVEEAQVMTEEQVRVMAGTDPDKLRQNIKTLSPDMKILAFSLLEKTVINPADPALAFPLEVRKTTNMLVAIGTVTTLMDHCANGDDSFALAMRQTDYAALIECAKGAGYDLKLPEIKALPVTDDGKVVVEAKKVKVGEAEKKKLQEEKKIREGEKPELDPEKITSEEDLKKALTYMFITQGGRRLTGTLTDGIEFMKKFRLHEASLAENADAAKAKFESYNSGDWLDDLFSYVQPSVFFTGIGRGMANVTVVEKNPIHAFVIFRDAVKDKETGNPVLSDQELAYCVKSIMKWYCNVAIASNKKSIEEFDAKKNAKDIEACKHRIADLEKAFEYFTNPSFDDVISLLENIGSKFTEDGSSLTPECQKANSIFNMVCKTYYGKQLSTADYKNLDTNIQQYAGCIINMFREAGSDDKNYAISNITELEERTAEEKEAIIKEAKKEWADRKKASEKNA